MATEDSVRSSTTTAFLASPKIEFRVHSTKAAALCKKAMEARMVWIHVPPAACENRTHNARAEVAFFEKWDSASKVSLRLPGVDQTCCKPVRSAGLSRGSETANIAKAQ